jgi:tetratricopeptide (TPR) repeat protein
MRSFLWSFVLCASLVVQSAWLDSAYSQTVVRRVVKPVTSPATQPAVHTAPVVPAEPPGKTLDDCHAQFMRGQYSAAAAGFKSLLSQESMRLGAAIGLAEALAMEGKYTEAMDALSKAPQGAADKDVKFHLQYADVLSTVGEYDKALAHAVKACELAPLSAPAVFARGRLLETLGRRKEAVDVYSTSAKILEDGKYRTNAEALVAVGQILDRQGVLGGKKASDQAKNILQNYLQQAYLDVDAKYWPANVAAGMFGISKHRPDIADAEFKLANAVNPRIPDTYVGYGWLMLENWGFEQCGGYVNQALSINPNNTDALILKANCTMQWRKFTEVPAILDQILKINPNHIDALSLYAAVHIRVGDKDKAQPYIDRVHKISPSCLELPSTIANWLSAGRQFDQALGYYQEAAKLAPDSADVLTGLGLLYMQTGQEDKAREVLQKASDIDDYRADVINYLQLLEKLGKFKIRETEHFIIKVDGDTDAVLLDQVAEQAELIHRDVCSDFAFEPKEKSILEFFPTHQQFSIRITGKGWIGTVGASTGRVIAMVVPTPDPERSPFGTFDWYAVVRHEYTHTVTLGKTHNRIPHWFTEACAVWEQPDRRNFQATQQLVMAYLTNHLFPVHEMDWGFIRPKANGDRELAYAQAEWTMEYIIATYKYPMILKMLDGFTADLSQKDVFEKIVGQTEVQFDAAFHAWAKGQIEEWGFDTTPPPNPQQAIAEAKAKPNDAAAQAKLAFAMFITRQMPAAEQAARAALAIDPNQRVGLSVLCRVLQGQKKNDEALVMARKLETVDVKSKVAPRVIADICIEKRQWGEAIEALETLKVRAPLDAYSYTQLSQYYLNIGQMEKALPDLIELHEHTMNTPIYARQIADIYRALKQDDLALKYYTDVTRLNPYDSAAYEAMARIQLHAKRYPEAVNCAKNLTVLAPQAAHSWFALAWIEFYCGKPTHNEPLLRTARADADKSMKIEPSDACSDLIHKIDETLKGGQ